ncbi:Pumilio like [Schistosoma japonicum]|nr:Pumilio like [Schistosoma japonicum]
MILTIVFVLGFLTKRERRSLKLKSKKHSDSVIKLLPLWEQFRRDDVTKEKRFEFIQEVLRISKNIIPDLCMAHDTSRILEDCVKYGTESQRWQIFSEIHTHLVRLVKSRYAKFVLLKLIKYGDKQHVLEMFKAFKNRIQRLSQHKYASEIIDTLYNDCATASQRNEMIQEFYGNRHALKLVLPISVSEKSCTNNTSQPSETFVPYIIDESVDCKDEDVMPKSFHDNFTTLIETLIDGQIVPMLHTRDGVRAALRILWLCNPQKRKILVKGLKTCEILDDLELFVMHPNARKVLLYMLSPRDRRHFSPQLIDSVFVPGDTNIYTKKLLGVRALEMRSSQSMVLPALLDLVHDKLVDLFIGDSLTDVGLLASKDLGRIILLGEILDKSAPHNLHADVVLPAYKRTNDDTRVQFGNVVIPKTDLSNYKASRKLALKKFITHVLVPKFQPSGNDDENIRAKQKGNHDDLRLSRHRSAVLLVEAYLAKQKNPKVKSFSSGNETEENDQHMSVDEILTMDQSDLRPFIERPEGMLLIRRLLQTEKETKVFTFARLIMNIVPVENFQSWITCNRTSFILVNLWELGDAEICNQLKEALNPVMDTLKISPLFGAKVLYNHLNQQ